MGEKIKPRDLRAMGDSAGEFNLAVLIREWVDKGYEVVQDPKLLDQIRLLQPDGIVEEWGVDLPESLENDPEFEYQVVIDRSGVREVMGGKPNFALLRKSKGSN